jgi:hypothetical protein
MAQLKPLGRYLRYRFVLKERSLANQLQDAPQTRIFPVRKIRPHAQNLLAQFCILHHIIEAQARILLQGQRKHPREYVPFWGDWQCTGERNRVR